MAVIEVKNLTKDYKVNKKGKGLGGAIKAGDSWFHSK